MVVSFEYVSSFPAEILEKPVSLTGKCFASCFASLILRDQQLSTQFPKKNNSVCGMLYGQSHRITLYQGCVAHRRLVTGENCWKESRSRKTVRFAVVGLEKVVNTLFHQ